MLRHVTPETGKSSSPIRITELLLTREDTGSLALAPSHGSGSACRRWRRFAAVVLVKGGYVGGHPPSGHCATP